MRAFFFKIEHTSNNVEQATKKKKCAKIAIYDREMAYSYLNLH